MDSLYDLFSNTAFLFAFIFFAVLILGVFATLWFKGFSEERRYIKMEMERSGTKGRKYWKTQLRRLYVSQIPLVGPFLCRFIKNK